VLLEQHYDLKTIGYEDIAVPNVADATPCATYSPPSAQVVTAAAMNTSTNCISFPAWPNPACKAWQAPPEYYHTPLYTADQRAIRDKTIWTTVQAILAPLQFLVFLISLGLVVRFLATGHGYEIATASIVAKTIILYVIMITGSIWEKVVFGEWLFVDAFFWEDVFSMLVLGLQTLYLGSLIFGWWTPTQQILIAVAAYVTYLINAAQFIWKLRIARLEGAKASTIQGREALA
jgi:3-vinyl bacteriochlorophyllide hydratase